ncbi:YD repeat-containing protein [Luteibacter sp. OK325]|nr:YD repeat-containing protein [Luteibacter sp. OK325]
MSVIDLRWGRARLALALLVVLGVTPSHAQSAAVTPETEFQKRIKVSEDINPVGEHPFGENISLYNGGLSFEENDIKLSGQGPDIDLTRSFHPADTPPDSVYYDFIDNAFVDWSLETPRIETLSAASSTANEDPAPDAPWFFITDAQRCSESGGPPDEFVTFKGTVITYPADDWWHGYQLIVPGQGSQDLLARDAGNGQVPTMTDASGNAINFPLLSKSRWAVGCTAATTNGQPGEGFIAVSPDGTKYYMDVLQYKKTDGIAEGGGGALHRRVATMVASRVVDRFGNSVSYTYDANGNLTEVDGSDGRQVTLTYESWQNPFKNTGGVYYDPPGYRVHSITVQPTSAAARTWTYTYDTVTDPVIPRLSSVTLPDGSSWQFHLAGFAPLPGDGSLISNAGCDYTLRPQDAVTSSGTITQPSGVTGTFTLQSTIRGRSNVPKVCLNANISPQLRFPAAYKSNSLIQRTLSGAGIGTQTWTYSYSSPNDSWSPCTGCATTVSTEMVDPSNRTTRYTFSNQFDASESLLLETDFYTAGDTSALVRSEASLYSLPPADGTWNYPWPQMLGRSAVLAINSDQMGQLTPVNTKTTVEEGDTYVWAAQAFDAFANPTQITRSNSIAGQTPMVETTTYLDDPAFWVLGLPLVVTNISPTLPAPETESVNTYAGADQLQSRSRFGQPLMSYTYDAAGQLATFTDPLNHTTSLSAYQRGLPTTVTHPDQTTEHIGVNEFGEVASVTDQNGNATSYTYDSVGRLGQISYPAGDSVAWAPKTFAYAYVSGAEAGVDANHWRRTITQGDKTQLTYFDSLLRPLVSQRYRSSDGGLPTTTVTVHDWKGNVTFQSYAVDGLQPYGAVTTGITTNYDELSRPIQAIQPSEDGTALTTTTSYLSGARKSVTDPKNNTTTTSYQVFDEPELKNAVLVQAPEGVSQTIARDLYGNPTSIAQGGLTKTLVYDPFKRVCRSYEPETKSTVTSYDAANNVAWSAKGQDVTEDGCGYDQALAADIVTRTYDMVNRLTSVTYGDGVTPEADFSYTPTGKPLTESSGPDPAKVQWLFTYNKRDLSTGQSLSVDGYIWPVGVGYDINGVVAAVTYPDGKAVPLSPDALGRPTQAGNYATSASYFPDDQLLHFTLGNGADYLAERNARNLLQDFSYSQGSNLTLSEGFKYDADANIAELDDLIAGGQRTRTFGYDGLNRLTTAASGLWGADTYNYDPLNNLVSVASGGQTNTYTYDATNKLTSIGGGGVSRAFVYDTHGNVTTNGPEHYTFDKADRMTAINASTDTYVYDAEGRRVKAVVSGVTTYSLYTHDGELLWQFDPVANSGTDYIYLGKKLVARTNNVLVPVAPALTAPATAVAKTAYTVSWTATPATTGYELQEEPDGSAWTTITTGTALNKAITQTAAATYHYQVHACNAGGCGAWSAIATTVVAPPPSAPVAPASVSASVAGNLASITVTWSSPPTATSYDLQQQLNSGTWTAVYSGTATTASVANPGDGSYVYQVHACNAVGCSVWVASAAVHVAHVPPAPASISVPATSTGVLGISWSAATYATSYSLEQSTNNVNYAAVYNGAATSASIGVGATGVYYYRARACDANGCGPYSPVAASTVTIPPSQAPNIAAPATSSNGCYTVNWGGFAGMTSYVMQENTNGAGWVTIANNGSGALPICGKGNGTYYYRVQGCNAGGCGPFSATVAVTVALLPAPPANLTALTARAPGKMEAIAKWDASAGATSYQLTATWVGGGGGLVYNGPNLTALVFPQGVNTQVSFYVKACNANGCSANSNGAVTDVDNGP